MEMTGANKPDVLGETKVSLDAAIDWYKQAIRIDARHGHAHFNLGNAYLSQGKPDQAIVSYHEAVQLNPELVEAHYTSGKR